VVLPKNETASDHHVKTKLLMAVVLSLGSQTGQALACSVCYGARDGKTSEHMAVAIWVLLGVVMSVMGGVGAFSFHLWRHANMPLEPHQELTDEDLDRYE
jgi:putative Mn2+ efflux pump MntP